MTELLNVVDVVAMTGTSGLRLDPHHLKQCICFDMRGALNHCCNQIQEDIHLELLEDSQELDPL
jgi:hypothetical protein